MRDMWASNRDTPKSSRHEHAQALARTRVALAYTHKHASTRATMFVSLYVYICIWQHTHTCEGRRTLWRRSKRPTIWTSSWTLLALLRSHVIFTLSHTFTWLHLRGISLRGIRSAAPAKISSAQSPLARPRDARPNPSLAHSRAILFMISALLVVRAGRHGPDLEAGPTVQY